MLRLSNPETPVIADVLVSMARLGLPAPKLEIDLTALVDSFDGRDDLDPWPRDLVLAEVELWRRVDLARRAQLLERVSRVARDPRAAGRARANASFVAGELARELGRHEEAIALQSRALEQGCSTPDRAGQLLAESLVLTGRIPEARAAVDRVEQDHGERIGRLPARERSPGRPIAVDWDHGAVLRHRLRILILQAEIRAAQHDVAAMRELTGSLDSDPRGSFARPVCEALLAFLTDRPAECARAARADQLVREALVEVEAMLRLSGGEEALTRADALRRVLEETR